MNSTMKQQQTLARLKRLSAATCIVLLIAALPRTWAGPGNLGNPGVIPPQSKAYGMTYGEWSGAWWRWAWSFPADINPVLDTTGQYATQGQSGDVWFLAGTFGGAADRTVTVPAKKALFFPIANQTWINTPEFGDNPWSPEQDAYAREVIKGLLDNITEIGCQIDGREVLNLASYRCLTPPGKEYMVTFPENSVWLPAGTYGPAVDDGYYLMVAPLTKGQHVIHITADFADHSFGLDVTYHLTVK